MTQEENEAVAVALKKAWASAKKDKKILAVAELVKLVQKVKEEVNRGR